MSASDGSVWLVTGASRGIGLEIVRQLSADAFTTVIATLRNPSSASALREIEATAKGPFHIVQLDTASEESIVQATKDVENKLNGNGVDYILNNAAIMPVPGDDRAFNFSGSNLSNVLNTNVTGPALVAKHFLHLIEKSHKKTVVNFTSGLASFGLDCGPKNSSYSISKAAINMLTYKQAAERKDFTFICVDPGWVQTDMGGPGAVLPVNVSVEHVLKLVRSLTPHMSGKFYNYEGKEQPWLVFGGEVGEHTTMHLVTAGYSD